jgi:hypothetical protein
MDFNHAIWSALLIPASSAFSLAACCGVTWPIAEVASSDAIASARTIMCLNPFGNAGRSRHNERYSRVNPVK